MEVALAVPREFKIAIRGTFLIGNAVKSKKSYSGGVSWKEFPPLPKSKSPTSRKDSESGKDPSFPTSELAALREKTRRD